MCSTYDAREKLCGTWWAFTDPCGANGAGMLRASAEQRLAGSPRLLSAAESPACRGITSRSRNALTSRESPPTLHRSKIQRLVFP